MSSANTTTGNGAGAEAPGGPKQAQVNILGQYVKDLSFENPTAPKSLQGPGTNPNLQINVNVNIKSLAQQTYEVELTFQGSARNDEGPIYNLELVYAGAFRLKDVPEEAIQPFLFIEGPAILFPFVRRLIADLTREGGFPPLLLDPIDFAGLYRQKIAQQDEGVPA